jgi:pyruvate dehydrogenase E2 component (dihydrolipoamide acetyltransferase)
MANKILMPKLSPTMEEGQISRWLKKEGDSIEANETIAEVDTDKATMEMTSLEAGTLLKIVVPAGGNARLGQTIGVIGKPGEEFSSLLADEAVTEKKTKEVPEQKKEEPKLYVPPVAAPAQRTVAPTATPAPTKAPSNGRLIVSPIAARMAAEHRIDINSIAGSGPGGRIIKRDIESAMNGGGSKSALFSYTPSTVYGASAYREEATTKMRQVIASRLSESIGPIPTFYLTTAIEMDNVLDLRAKINSELKDGEKISVNDIIVKVVSHALMRHPFVNASYRDTAIRFYEDADIGVAVAVEDGLITPVIRSANKKGFVDISREIKSLASKARERKLQPEEYTGATFSISNLGMFGITEFTAIINPPEAAILAVGSSTPTPVVKDGVMTVRNIMKVTLSCDHRVIDGATGAKFLQTFKNMMEQPVLMFM